MNQIFHLSTSNRPHFTYQYVFFFALSFSLNVCTVHVFVSVISYFAYILLLFVFLPFISFRLFTIARSSIIFGSLLLAFWHCRSFWLQLQLFLLFIRTLFHPICNTFKLDVIVFNDNNIAIATPHQSVQYYVQTVHTSKRICTFYRLEMMINTHGKKPEPANNLIMVFALCSNDCTSK